MFCRVCRIGLRQPLCWRARHLGGAALASFRSIGVGSVSHCGGGQIGKFALVSPLILRSTWAQSMWWRADRQGRWFDRSPFPMVGLVSVTVVAVPLSKALLLARLCSLGRRGLSQLLSWLSRYMMTMLWSLTILSACSQPANMVACTTVEGGALASVCLLGVGSFSNYVGGEVR